MASKGSKGKVEQANKVVEGMTTTIMSCVATRHEVEVRTGHPVVQWGFCGVGTFSTRRRWSERQLPTAPEALPKYSFTVCRDRSLARSRTSHVETSIQVELQSVVGPTSGERQPRDWNSRWVLHGERSAKDAAKFTKPDPRAPEREGDPSTSRAQRTSRIAPGVVEPHLGGRQSWQLATRGGCAPDERNHDTIRSTTADTRRANGPSSDEFQRHRVERW